MKAAYIIAAGDLEDTDFYYSLAKDGFIICADGGFDNAMEMGLKPDVVLGDMDSVRTQCFDRYKVIKFPVKKDKTDTHLAIDYALSEGFRDIKILCAFGGRISHELANIMLLEYISQNGATGVLLSPTKSVFLLSGIGKFEKNDAKYISIIPLSESAVVTANGVLYPIERRVMRSQTYGISNEFLDNVAEFEVHEGSVFVIIE